MPLFDYHCETCFISSENYVSSPDSEVTCECGKPMQRVRVSKVTGIMARPTGGIMANGQKVPGFFGKDAPKKRRQRARS